MGEKIKLIINADDYGLSPLFNRGIIELAKKNIISSLSVMVKREAINTPELNRLKNISLGLHLELQADDTLEEIESQIKIFEKFFGRLPSHLDSHKHTHLTEKNLSKIIATALKYSLPVRSYKSINRKAIKSAGLKTPDAYIDWHPERVEILERDFKNLGVPTAEMVCHPGYYDKNSDVYYNHQREKELEFLKSQKFAEIIKQFEIINYNNL